MRFILLFSLLFCSDIFSAQLLRISNLQHLSASTSQHLDDKLVNHFDLLRHHDQENDGIRVYSNTHKSNAKTVVVTAFIKTSGCHVFSIVSHDENEVKILHQELLKNNFKHIAVSTSEHQNIQKFEKENHRFIIKNPDKNIDAHQIVFMCK